MLTVYAWLAGITLIAFLFLVARFYEVKSGARSHFRLFLLSILLFLMAAAFSAFGPGGWVADPIANVLFFLGGATLIVLDGFLLRLMTGGRR